MIWRRAALVGFVCIAHPAFAEDPDTLTARGEELARAGEFTRAIDLFKQADAITPSARRACLIGLVYTRRELWSQAEIFLDRCKQRATASDPLPDWFTAATAQLEQKLHGVDVAELVVQVAPASVAGTVQLTVSTFPPDETFEPRTIHLTPGIYVITATAPGSPAVRETVTVKLGAHNAVTLTIPVAPSVPPSRRPQTAVHAAKASPLERWLLIGAGGALVLGGGFHIVAAIERGKLDDALAQNDPDAWNSHSGTFEVFRGATIGCYVAAVIAAAVGLQMRLSQHDDVVVTGNVGPGIGMIGIELRR